MFAKLIAVVAQALGMLRVAREKEQTHVLIRIGARDNDPSLLETSITQGVNIVRPICPPVLICSYP